MSDNPKRNWGWTVARKHTFFSPRSTFRMWVLWAWHPSEPQASSIISCAERCCHLLCAPTPKFHMKMKMRGAGPEDAQLSRLAPRVPVAWLQ